VLWCGLGEGIGWSDQEEALGACIVLCGVAGLVLLVVMLSLESSFLDRQPAV
jgi:Flp pilus assembly protein protease CpaA